MNCIIVFDHLNDVLFTKYNKNFALHLNEYAKSNGLHNEVFAMDNITENLLVQVFSPIVTSQRIMSCQFGNSFTSIQCLGNLNLTFEEYMGYLIINIGNADIDTMRKHLGICVTIIRYFCGPDLSLLKSNDESGAIVKMIMETYLKLSADEQSMYIEAVEQLYVNQELSAVCIQTAKQVSISMEAATHYNKIHALLLVQNKFLSLYSSPHASDLAAADILFLILLNASRKQDDTPSTAALDECYSVGGSETEPEEFHSSHSSPLETLERLDASVSTWQVLLAGADSMPRCTPHIVHLAQVAPSVTLVVAVENGDRHIAGSLYTVFSALHMIQLVQLQRDRDVIRPVFTQLDTAVRRLCDLLRKVKDTYVECCYRQLMRKWEFMRKKYADFFKNNDDEALLRAESCTMGMLETLRQILTMMSFDQAAQEKSAKYVPAIAKLVIKQLQPYEHFLNVKALQNFSLGSRNSITVHKYLEEFPGLVHFLFIDRSHHRVTTPTLHFQVPNTNTLTKDKIWSMVKLARRHLQQGHLSLQWKDTIFNYAYFLWFEDSSGSAIKPNVFPSHTTKPLPVPGVLQGDYYHKLKEVCFPKITPAKIRCYELFCIHLGLATASCVLEHTRRLAATIWDLQGHPNHPMDLF